MKNRYAGVWWIVDDVREERPEMTIKECAKWLDDHESIIREIMFKAGHEYIIRKLKRGTDHV